MRVLEAGRRSAAAMRCIGPSRHVLAVQPERAGQGAPDGAGRQARRDEAQGGLAGLARAGKCRRPRHRPARGRARQRRPARHPHTDSRCRAGPARQTSPLSRTGAPAPPSTGMVSTSSHLSQPLTCAVGGHPQQRPAAGPREAASLERHRPLLDLADGAQDHGSHDGHHAPERARARRPRCRDPGPAARRTMLRARSTISGTVWTDALATKPRRGETPRRSRSRTRSDGRVVR